MSSSTVFDPICRGLTQNEGKTVMVCLKRSREKMKNCLTLVYFVNFYFLGSHISVNHDGHHTEEGGEEEFREQRRQTLMACVSQRGGKKLTTYWFLFPLKMAKRESSNYWLSSNFACCYYFYTKPTNVVVIVRPSKKGTLTIGIVGQHFHVKRLQFDLCHRYYCCALLSKTVKDKACYCCSHAFYSKWMLFVHLWKDFYMKQKGYYIMMPTDGTSSMVFPPCNFSTEINPWHD